jgi:hypothetical protein
LPSATWATASPGSTTLPVVSGTCSTRPAIGARTAPSLICCATTVRSAVRDASALVATSTEVRA